ncbi:hypothetical protein RND71_009961 [Anisodus tanguticus]|uniref:Auxin efflux carrier component n=1 Tax=Anisodus tanguticus TaxID=243964 RepID=A0AAE1SIU8_9SOLA|nr:hypothetical protein RND71_009961 [Anisodus tanguticus]
MIGANDIYKVMCAMMPLYFAMLVAYGSVKWCKIFSPEQCSGINRFVAVFAVPVLSFHFISQNNPYQMDTKFILADTLSKILVLVLLSIWTICKGQLDWLITLFSISTLPNTLVMGIPLLNAMYGDFTQSLMVQLVVLQCIIWYLILTATYDLFNPEKEISFRDISNFPVQEGAEDSANNIKQEMPNALVMLRLIIVMVGRKLSRNPNSYSSILGLLWSLVSFKWNVGMPSLVRYSIKIISDAGLGMAMFSLGLFMALQPRIIACGTKMAAIGMAIRFIGGPLVMSTASIAVGLRGVRLHTAIVQAALPQGIVPFVFAREYGLHPDILSTG